MKGQAAPLGSWSEIRRSTTRSSWLDQLRERRITVDDLAGVLGNLQVIGRADAGRNGYRGVLDRLGLFPNIDPIIAVVVPGNLHAMQAGRLSDFRQYLGRDLFCVVWRRSFFLLRNGLFGFIHYFLR